MGTKDVFAGLKQTNKSRALGGGFAHCFNLNTSTRLIRQLSSVSLRTPSPLKCVRGLCTHSITFCWVEGEAAWTQPDLKHSSGDSQTSFCDCCKPDARTGLSLLKRKKPFTASFTELTYNYACLITACLLLSSFWPCLSPCALEWNGKAFLESAP